MLVGGRRLMTVQTLPAGQAGWNMRISGVARLDPGRAKASLRRAEGWWQRDFVAGVGNTDNRPPTAQPGPSESEGL